MYTVDAGKDFFVKRSKPENYWGEISYEQKTLESCFYNYIVDRIVSFGSYDGNIKPSKFAQKLCSINPKDYE